MTASTSTHTPERTGLTGAPPRYDELKEYFPHATERREALFVAFDTIRAWDSQAATRLRASSVTKVDLLLWACQGVSRYMRDRSKVGRWMLNPQPVLRGARPVDVIHGMGERGVELVLFAATPPSRPLPGGTLTDEDWTQMGADMPAKTRENVRRLRGRLAADKRRGPLL